MFVNCFRKKRILPCDIRDFLNIQHVTKKQPIPPKQTLSNSAFNKMAPYTGTLNLYLFQVVISLSMVSPVLFKNGNF